MSIWISAPALEKIDAIESKSAAHACGIRISAIGPDWLEASMPLSERTIDSSGAVHPGALSILVETVGSVASTLCIDWETRMCVGQSIQVYHPEPIRDTPIRGRASPIIIDSARHIWNIAILNDEDAVVASGVLTMAILAKHR